MNVETHRDLDVQTAVRDELEWTRDVDAAGIGAAVQDGVVTLSGTVENYSERLAAKHAALRVHGVITVVDKITVRPSARDALTDDEIAHNVEHALTWASNVPDTVKSAVADRHVTLTGRVDWDYQRRAAVNAVKHLVGVTGVHSAITLVPRSPSVDAEERIREALTRNAQFDARTIDVAVEDTVVILTGSVRSWAQKRQAGLAAGASPHVTDVENLILVRPH